MVLLTLAILVAMLAVMAAAWLFQRATANGGWVDVFWTYGTGACCGVAALAPVSPGASISWRQAAVAAIMAMWSLRLGTYVALRVARGPEDARYAIIRRDWGAAFQRKMLGLLLVQAPVTALLGIGILYAARQPSPALRLADIAGLLIVVAAIAGESLADAQMTRFKSDPRNRGKICEAGLWGWSRHPNYFFEATFWLACPVVGLDVDRPWSVLSFLAPVMMFLVLRYGTGVPPLEAAMVQSRGDAYRNYQARVSALLPLPPGRG